MALLTPGESSTYLHDILHIKITETPPLSITADPGTAKLSFLEKVIRSFLEHEPFQSISLMSQNITERRRPSWHEIKKDMFSRHGGLCYSLNTFMFGLLTSLGYEVSMTHCSVTPGIPSFDNHIVLLVHDLLTSGDIYLVDVGVGYYIPRAVPLDFPAESPEYTDSFQTYKFVRETEDRITLQKKVFQSDQSSKKNREQHREGSSTHIQSETSAEATTETSHQPEVSDKTKTFRNGDNDKPDEMKPPYQWQEFFFFNPLVQFKNLDEFYPCFDLHYSDITKLSMHTSPRAMCWPGGRYLGLVNSKLVQEMENAEIVKSVVPGCEIPSIVSSALASENCGGHNDTQITQEGNLLLRAEKSDSISGLGLSNLNKRINSETEGNGGMSHEKLDTECRPKERNDHSHWDIEPLIQAYQQYFPQFSSLMVRAALENWKLTGSLAKLPSHLG